MIKKRTEHNGYKAKMEPINASSGVPENPCVLGSIPRLATTDSAGFSSTGFCENSIYLPHVYHLVTCFWIRAVPCVEPEGLRIDPHGLGGRKPIQTIEAPASRGRWLC